ncbi:MAG: T9SS type A sorting domain-containing protein [Bacteroidota bacterium]
MAKIHDASAPTETTTPTSVQMYSNETAFVVYPNPFSTSTTLQIKGPFENGPFELNIYNILGQELKKIKNISSSTITFSTDNLPQGIYTFQLSGKTGAPATGKLLKEQGFKEPSNENRDLYFFTSG